MFILDICVVYCVMRYGYELLAEYLFLVVFEEWQVSSKNEFHPSGGEYDTSKMT